MFPFGFSRAFDGSRLSVLGAVLSVVLALFAPLTPAVQAHEGHDHSAAESIAGPAAPRLSARSEVYEIVGVLRGERLVIYLDRSATNEPVTTADIAVTIGDAADPVNAEWSAEGTYTLTSPKFLTAGPVELVFSITGEAGEDLLAGTLTVPSDAMAAAPGASTISALWAWLTSFVSPLWQMVLMIAQEGSPGLRRRPTAPDHVLGDRRLGDLEPKLEQFTVDARGAPQPVLPTHLPNELAQLATNLGASRLTARLPTPVGSKPCSVPAQNRGWPKPRKTS